jgi:hypothetical protein
LASISTLAPPFLQEVFAWAGLGALVVRGMVAPQRAALATPPLLGLLLHRPFYDAATKKTDELDRLLYKTVFIAILSLNIYEMEICR